GRGSGGESGAGGGASGGDGEGGTTGGDVVSFTCDLKATATEQAMKRLTTTQYRNTIRDLVDSALGGKSDATGIVMQSLQPALAKLPADKREVLAVDNRGTFRRLDQDIQQVHADAAYAIATAVGAALTQPTRIATVVGACATDGNASNDEACLSGFIDRFARMALRRPINASEKTLYRSVYGAGASADPAGYADVIASLLLSPSFIFQMEHGTEAVAGKTSTFALSPQELANRLAYQLWDTMPDAPLRAAADAGELKDSATYAAQLDRMLDDPRAVTTVKDFFQDWLKLELLPAFDQIAKGAAFKAFSAANLPTANLRQDMIDELMTTVEEQVWKQGGSVSDLFLDDHIYTRGAELARIYGVQPWDGTSEPLRFAEGTRPGLLTRAALHSYGSTNTRPVMKGVFIRRAILCDELPPPPEDAAAVEPVPTETLQSTRQLVEAITEQTGSPCKTCHGTILNGIGFATENIDSLGRLRSEQKVFNIETGALRGTVPIDTQSAPRVDLDDETLVDGPQGLAELIAGSPKPAACLARQVFRFSFGRLDDPETDGCALEQMRKRLRNGGSVRGMFREVTLVPAFSQRFIP
ncbi:MAG: DUF1592 domain-containing protein, partial [Deltaproteobacteria bacterium]|nr:DUF1592 domain-containing protein [Deltaproteobacteria bacterium]